MRSVFSYLKMEKGVTTLAAVMIVALVGVVLAGVVPMVSQSVRANVSNKDQIQAVYAAESGIKRAIEEFKQDTNYNQWGWLDKEIHMDGSCGYIVNIKKDPMGEGRNNYYRIESKGFVESAMGINGAKTICVAYVSVEEQGNEMIELFKDYAVYAKGNAEFAGQNAVISGCVGILGTSISNNTWNHVEVSNKYGDEYRALKENEKKMQLSGITSKSVDFQAAMPRFKVLMENNPSYPMAQYESAPKINTNAPAAVPEQGLKGEYYMTGFNYYNQSIKLIGDTILYVDGNVGLSGNTSKIEGDYELTIVATGSVELSNKSQIAVKKLRIYSNKNVTLSNESNLVTDDCLIVAEDSFNLTNNTKITAKDKSLLYKNPVHIYVKKNMDFSVWANIEGCVTLRSEDGDINSSNNFGINQYMLSPGNQADINDTYVTIAAKNIYLKNDTVINGTKLVMHAQNALEINGANARFNFGIKEYATGSRSYYKTKVEIYSDNFLNLVNGCFISGHDLLIQSMGNMELTGALQLNGYRRGYSEGVAITNSITRINSHGNLKLSANQQLGSLTDIHKESSGGLTIAAGTMEHNYGIITAKGTITTSNYIDAGFSLLIAEGDINLQGQPWFYGIYSNGNVKMNWVTNCKLNMGYKNTHDFEEMIAAIAGHGYLPMVDNGIDSEEPTMGQDNKVEIEKWIANEKEDRKF